MPEPSDRTQKAGGGAAATAGAPRRLPVPAGRGAISIAGGEIHFLDFDLEAGDLLEAVAEQRGVDLVLRLVDPAGRVAIEVDSPTGARGPEELVEIAGMAGRYRLEIVAPEGEDAVGEYVLRAETRRPATGEDRALVEADRALHRGRGLEAGGEYRAAVEPLREALAAFRSLELDRRQAFAAVRLVTAYRRLDDAELAYHYATVAAESFRRSGDLQLAAEASRSAGWFLLRLGQPAGAVPILEAARELADAAGDPRGAALALADLGAAWHDLGRMERAVGSFEEALERIRTTGDDSAAASILTDLAGVRADLHRSQEALEAASEATEIYRRRERPREAAIASAAVARAAVQLGDLARAETAALEAVAALAREPGVRDRIVALATLGSVLRRRGELDRARAALAEALELAEGDARREGLALLELGKLHLDGGDPPRALELETRALERFVEAADPVGQASARIRAAEALRDLGRVEEAWTLLEPALGAVERVRGETVRGDARRDYFAFRQEYFEIAVDLLMRRHALEPAAGHDLAAFEVHERRLARDLLETVGVEPPAAVPAALAERESGLAAALRGEEEEAALRRLIQELHRVRGEIRGAGRREAAARPRPVTVEEARRLLDGETVALVFALGETRSYLWVIDRQEATSHVLPAAADLEALAERFRETLHERRKGAADVRREIGRRLSDALFASAAPRLGRRRLVVVAEGALQAIPFGALPEPGGELGDDYLIRRREIVVLPSLTALAALREPGRERPGREVRIAAFADPVFTLDDPRVGPPGGGLPAVGLPAGGIATGRRAGRARGPGGSRDLERSAVALGVDPLSRLDHTRTEAEAILALAPGRGHRLATGFEARREAVTGGAPGAFTVLHFATHGLLHPRHPELSGLVLSLVDEAGEALDGFLYSFEIADLDLGADLVVLSACETAAGRQVRGEGALSLVRSFFAAGSPRVIGTLWRVGDRGTSALMTAFYEDHLTHGTPPAAALQRAQRAALGDPDRADPYHWAGFVYYGDWLPARAPDARGERP